MERMLDNLTTNIYAMCGETFNINSTQQLSKILFDKLQLPVARKTKTGYSTDVAVLESLRLEHLPLRITRIPAAAEIEIDICRLVASPGEPGTGRLHTSFNQAVASTGRLSSSRSDLQKYSDPDRNREKHTQGVYPRKSELRIMSADYSQIELRDHGRTFRR